MISPLPVPKVMFKLQPLKAGLVATVASTLTLFGVGAVLMILIAVERFGIANNKAAVFKPLTTPAGVMLKVNVGTLAVTLRTTDGAAAVAAVASLTATVIPETVTAMLVAFVAAAQPLEIVALVMANCTVNEDGVNGIAVVKSAKVALTVALP